MALQIRALVTAKWLWDAVGTRTRSNPRVLDASWYIPAMNRDPKKEFTQPGHIPGSSPFDIDSCSDTASPYPHMLPSEGFFAEYVGNLGIGTRTHVVVYDASEFGSFSAPRVWWMFRAFGHGSVSVLDGGLKAWVREGYPLTGEYTKPEPVEFRANLDRSRVKSYQDVLENLESKRFQLLDVKTPGRYNGTEPEPMEDEFPAHLHSGTHLPILLEQHPKNPTLPHQLCYPAPGPGPGTLPPRLLQLPPGWPPCVRHPSAPAHPELCCSPGVLSASLLPRNSTAPLTPLAPDHRSHPVQDSCTRLQMP
ncbi:3-mercaptopyruvate sulfurtransferase-like isoform X1 [Acipenser ruthenus]|uniref:3-mercaptopyruvate sulfurtransferase-like isoform X1 n=1 Tax=Acipenser ruthenus TaxID=7906 RepID=UPI0027414844|nr:3-mercaptopyruvate sulfurtransferase-like isoform X1 [Acipenser ruthenus]